MTARAGWIAGAIGMVVMTLSACGGSAAGGAGQGTEPIDEELPIAVERAGTKGEELAAIAEGRWAAAAQSLEDEAARIAAAREAFRELGRSDPHSPRDFLVSFVAPLQAESFFETLLRVHGIDLVSVHTWVADVVSVSPTTGEHWRQDLSWSRRSPQHVAGFLRLHYVHTLSSLMQDIREAPGPPSDQLAEVARTLRGVKRDGVGLYGFRCFCSPASLHRFNRSFEQPVIRTAEIDVADGIYPLWPTDRLRELIIATGGRAGLE